MARQMTRREALVGVAAAAGFLHGRVTTDAQGRAVMALALDGVELIEVRYRAQTVAIYPQELIDALRRKEDV